MLAILVEELATISENKQHWQFTNGKLVGDVKRLVKDFTGFLSLFSNPFTKQFSLQIVYLQSSLLKFLIFSSAG